MTYSVKTPCQLTGWMKNSSYFSAKPGIRTSDLPHSMILSKITRCPDPQGNRGCFKCVIVKKKTSKKLF